MRYPLLLEETPSLLRRLVVDFEAGDLEWKPTPDRWSVRQVLAHLIHIDEVGFRDRIRRIVSAEHPELPGTVLPEYPNEAGTDILAAFGEVRRRSLEYVGSLPEELGARSGVHPEVGELAVSDLIHEWPMHDLSHVRQVAELVRAKRYHPRAGAWRSRYLLRP